MMRLSIIAIVLLTACPRSGETTAKPPSDSVQAPKPTAPVQELWSAPAKPDECQQEEVLAAGDRRQSGGFTEVPSSEVCTSRECRQEEVLTIEDPIDEATMEAAKEWLILQEGEPISDCKVYLTESKIPWIIGEPKVRSDLPWPKCYQFVPSLDAYVRNAESSPREYFSIRHRPGHLRMEDTIGRMIDVARGSLYEGRTVATQDCSFFVFRREQSILITETRSLSFDIYP